MKTIKLKTAGILYYITKLAFKDDAVDTCAYKKQLIIASIYALITFPASIARGIFFIASSERTDRDMRGPGPQLSVLIAMVLAFASGIGITDKLFAFKFDSSNMYINILVEGTVYFFVGACAIILLVAVVLAAAYSVWKIFTFLHSRILESSLFKGKIFSPLALDETDTPTTQLGELYYSTKNKWCSKIDWEDKCEDI